MAVGEGTVAARVELLRVLPASSLEEHTGSPSTSITGSKRPHVIPLASDSFYALSRKVSAVTRVDEDDIDADLAGFTRKS